MGNEYLCHDGANPGKTVKAVKWSASRKGQVAFHKVDDPKKQMSTCLPNKLSKIPGAPTTRYSHEVISGLRERVASVDTAVLCTDADIVMGNEYLYHDGANAGKTVK